MTSGWAHDALVESTPLDTTGGHTWKAAYRLADFLEASAQQLGLDREGLNILELGAGTGWLGVTLARNLPAAALVCLTEQEAGLAWLQHNVQLNQARGLPLPRVRVQPCDWLHYAAAATGTTSCCREQPCGRGDECQSSQLRPKPQGQSSHDSWGGEDGSDQSASQTDQRPACCREGGAGSAEAGLATAAAAAAAAAEEEEEDTGAPVSPDSLAAGVGRPRDNLLETQWDFIVGSDLIYNQVGSRCLPRVLQSLLGPTTQAFYCHTKHRYDLLDMEFFEALRECGLRCEEVWEPGVPPRPESPPTQFPPLDLFPEQRIAVYCITKPPVGK